MLGEALRDDPRSASWTCRSERARKSPRGDATHAEVIFALACAALPLDVSLRKVRDCL